MEEGGAQKDFKEKQEVINLDLSVTLTASEESLPKYTCPNEQTERVRDDVLVDYYLKHDGCIEFEEWTKQNEPNEYKYLELLNNINKFIENYSNCKEYKNYSKARKIYEKYLDYNTNSNKFCNEIDKNISKNIKNELRKKSNSINKNLFEECQIVKFFIIYNLFTF